MSKRIVLITFIFLFIFSYQFVFAADSNQTINIKTMTVEQFRNNPDNPAFQIVDVRSEKDRDNAGLHIPYDTWVNLYSEQALKSFIDHTRKNQTLIIYCNCPGDYEAIRAAQILEENGFPDIYVLQGGWKAWLRADMPISPIGRD